MTCNVSNLLVVPFERSLENSALKAKSAKLSLVLPLTHLVLNGIRKWHAAIEVGGLSSWLHSVFVAYSSEFEASRFA